MYVGRFAPSPSGPLHFGSLVCALASFLDARHHHGKWLVRIDDIDFYRQQAGATTSILQTLEAYHLYWDDVVYYQSHNLDQYTPIIEQLTQLRLTYWCECTRKRLRSLSNQYDGKCLNLNHTPDNKALRMNMNSPNISWNDIIQGACHYTIPEQINDFIIQRRDQLIGYQLAACVDDYHQGITHIIRGSDLLESTAMQLHLSHCLQWNTAIYAHIPVAVHQDGSKLSKQTAAQPLPSDIAKIKLCLFKALQFLFQKPPKELVSISIDEQLQWAIQHWDIKAILPTLNQPAANLII